MEKALDSFFEIEFSNLVDNIESLKIRIESVDDDIMLCKGVIRYRLRENPDEEETKKTIKEAEIDIEKFSILSNRLNLELSTNQSQLEKLKPFVNKKKL
jgi:hypothetical protein